MVVSPARRARPHGYFCADVTKLCLQARACVRPRGNYVKPICCECAIATIQRARKDRHAQKLLANSVRLSTVKYVRTYSYMHIMQMANCKKLVANS